MLFFEWCNDKVWGLREPIIIKQRRQFNYLLDLPFWNPDVGIPFSIKPIDVIKALSKYIYINIKE